MGRRHILYPLLSVSIHFYLWGSSCVVLSRAEPVGQMFEVRSLPWYRSPGRLRGSMHRPAGGALDTVGYQCKFRDIFLMNMALICSGFAARKSAIHSLRPLGLISLADHRVVTEDCMQVRQSSQTQRTRGLGSWSFYHLQKCSKIGPSNRSLLVRIVREFSEPLPVHLLLQLTLPIRHCRRCQRLGTSRKCDHRSHRGHHTSLQRASKLFAIDCSSWCFGQRRIRKLWVLRYALPFYPVHTHTISQHLYRCRLPGININSSWTYNASFFYRFPSTTPSTNLTASINLQTSSGTVLGTATAALIPSTGWTQVFVRIKPTASASDANNNFTVTFSGAQAAGRTVKFAMFSLFPPTFKGRANGMRMDIAEVGLE